MNFLNQMKTITHNPQPNETPHRRRSTSRLGIDYVRGYLELGMTREALIAAKHQLRSPALTERTFLGALNAILRRSKNISVWAGLVKRAFDRIPPRAQRGATLRMLIFLWFCKDWPAAIQHIPRRFTGPLRVLEMSIAMDILTRSGHWEEARTVVEHCRRELIRSRCEHERKLLRAIIIRFMEQVQSSGVSLRHSRQRCTEEVE
jgi:hypothetical protein